MSGNFLGCILGVKYGSNFKRERGIFLEMLQREGASSHDDGDTSWFFSSCGGNLELCWGSQGACHVAPGKSSLHLSCEGKLGIALESLQVKLTSSRLLSRKSVFLSNGNIDLGVTFKVHQGSQASSRVIAKNSALLFSCDGYLLEPIEWPKGSQASCGILREDSGLLSRPCRKRRASSRDDGRISWFFPASAQRVEFFSSYDGEPMKPLVWPQGSPVSIRVARGSTALLSIHCRGIWPQDALKGKF